MTLPAWLTKHLQDQGYMTDDGLTRRARPRPCRKCRATVIAGLDADLAALPAYVDPQPLTALGEAQAHLTGRNTYALQQIGGRHVLTRRDDFAIQGHPAATPGRQVDIHPQHICGQPATFDTTTSVFDHIHHVENYDGPPPY